MEKWDGKNIKLNNLYLYSKNRKRELRSNDILCLDIETTQLYNPHGEWITYNYDIPETDYSGKSKLSFPYIYMFGINDRIIYGGWSQLKDLLININDNGVKCVCYVHNLSFEFCFLRNFFHVEKVFARKAHSIMY